jgi:hypothetical protein
MIITSHAEAIHWDVCRRSESNEKHLVATSDGRQALQTGGPSPKQVDVLRLPNRDLVEDPAVYVQRKAASRWPTANSCRFEIESTHCYLHKR